MWENMCDMVGVKAFPLGCGYEGDLNDLSDLSDLNEEGLACEGPLRVSIVKGEVRKKKRKVRMGRHVPGGSSLREHLSCCTMTRGVSASLCLVSGP